MTQEKEHKRKEYLKEYKKEYTKTHTDIRISITNQDFKAFQLVAKKRGQTVTGFFRDAAFAQARNVYLFPQDMTDEIQKAVRQLRGEATNINQLARLSNETGILPGDIKEILLQALKRQEDIILCLQEEISKR